MAGGAVSIAVGGTATVYCVHNQPKRKVTEMAFDPSKTSLHLCSCCENLFTDPGDAPVFCQTCSGSTVYVPQGPLPEPYGRV